MISYRSIGCDDLESVKNLCQECFPVNYPERWFKSLTASSKYYTLAALHEGKIVGLIVARVKNHTQCNPEDIDILNHGLFREHKLVYILSLGVTHSYRNQGIASVLLNNLMDAISAEKLVKAIYLHVLTTNDVAIQFYERRGFYRSQLLPDYYSIEDKLQPAFTYVMYLNGGYPPRTLWNYIADTFEGIKMLSWIMTRCIIRAIRKLFQFVWVCRKRKFTDVPNNQSLLMMTGADHCISNSSGGPLSLISKKKSTPYLFKSDVFSNSQLSGQKLIGYDSSPLKL